MLSHLQLTFQHRAGVTPYTSTFVFAECCVFNKQSQPPIFCNPFMLRCSHHTTRAHLLPKLRCQFAEFLLLSSLKRLRILISRTSVGLRYGRVQLKLSGFSWDLVQLLRKQACSIDDLGIYVPDLPDTHLLPSKPGYPKPGQPIKIRPHIALHIGTGILTCFPSATHLCLTLGADLLYADERCIENLALTASGLFTRFNATHVSIRTSDISSSPLRSPSQTYRTLSYHTHCCASAASVTGLSPVTSSAQDDSISELLRFL